MRGFAYCLIMMLLAAWPVASLAAAAPPPPPLSQPASQPVWPELDPVVPLVEFRATSLGKAIDSLRDMTKVNIVVRWRTLTTANVEEASPVDLRVSNLPLQRVLELLGDVA